MQHNYFPEVKRELVIILYFKFFPGPGHITGLGYRLQSLHAHLEIHNNIMASKGLLICLSIVYKRNYSS